MPVKEAPYHMRESDEEDVWAKGRDEVGWWLSGAWDGARGCVWGGRCEPKGDML